MTETSNRAISGVVYIAILLFSIQYSAASFFALFGIFLLIATCEFCNLIKISKTPAVLIAITIYVSNIALSFYGLLTIQTLHSLLDYNIQINTDRELIDNALTAIALISSGCLILFLFNDKVQPVKPSLKYCFLIGYVIFPFVFITKIAMGVKYYNPKIIIGLFILIWTNDTFAYLVGKSIGKHKLYEKISPKKSIEGFIGGLFFTLLAGYLISTCYIIPTEEFKSTSIAIWTSIALVVGVFGTIGDLIESKFKRFAGVKDSGNIMPGHGGILDRLDSIIFVAPIIFIFYQILKYVS